MAEDVLTRNVSYKVVEIFSSIQGEGMNIGKSATFIRLAGCNLGCDFCDTVYTKGRKMSMNKVYDRVMSFSDQIVVITGGEPLLQDIKPLIHKLIYEGDRYVAVETNGTRPTQNYPCYNIWVAVSPKPASKYHVHADCHVSELKYVVTDDFSFDSISKEHIGYVPIWLQPLAQNFKESVQKALQIIRAHPKARLRLGIQAHKFWEVD